MRYKEGDFVEQPFNKSIPFSAASKRETNKARGRVELNESETWTCKCV